MKKYRIEHGDPSKAEEPAVAYNSSISVGSILGIDPESIAEPLRRIHTLRQGLSKTSFDRLKAVTGLDYNKLSSALAVSSKTLQRKDLFDVVQSEKMYELASLYSTGISYFGNEGFQRWMERPLFSIGNHRPIDLIDMSEGMEILKTEIMRLQHGIAV